MSHSAQSSNGTNRAMSGIWYMDMEQSTAVNPSAQIQTPSEQFPLKVQSLGQDIFVTFSNSSIAGPVWFSAVVVFLSAISSQSFNNIDAAETAKL